MFLMKASELEIFLSVEIYDKKTAGNCLNSYDAEKRLIFKLLKISAPNCDTTILESQLTH